MNIAIVIFPGSNCDKDFYNAILEVTGKKSKFIWYLDDFPLGLDLIIIPGGFSFGDYLRSGAIASKTKALKKIITAASKGISIIGICNGFQILTEASLLPGTLLVNSNLKFICKYVDLEVTNNKTRFSKSFDSKEIIRLPIAHKMGNYQINKNDLKVLEYENRILFKYVVGEKYSGNPNGSVENIAGIINEKGNICGMMPHPERAFGNFQENTVLKNILESLEPIQFLLERLLNVILV